MNTYANSNPNSTVPTKKIQKILTKPIVRKEKKIN